MNPTTRIFKVFASLSLLLAGSIVATVRSQENKKPLSQPELVAAARAIMTAARYCALITLDSSGRPQARTLDPFPPDEHMVVWLAFYPDRAKDYLLITVKPERLEVVNVKKGIVGDPTTWKPPSVNFRTRKPND